MQTMENLDLTPDLFQPLDPSEKNSEFIAAQPRTYLGDAWHRFKDIILPSIRTIVVLNLIISVSSSAWYSSLSWC